MTKHITVSSIEQAWAEANKLFPTDYEIDSRASVRAGYEIWSSTAAENFSWISDLGTRLELSIMQPDRSIESVMIWIDDKSDVEVEAVAESGEKRSWSTYAEFVKDYRFYLASGKPFKADEEAFEKLIKAVRSMNEKGIEAGIKRCGLMIKFMIK